MKNTTKNKTHKTAVTIAVIIFWLLVWQLLSIIIHSKILFASPLSVLRTLFKLAGTGDFWEAVAFSSGRIALGFLLGFTVGLLLSILSYRFKLFKALIAPIMKLIKAVPVASFILLALFWIRSKNLSVLISFVMVLPIIYSYVLQRLEATDRQLLEMAAVFRLKGWRRFRYIYLPTVMPGLVSACSVGLGFCWKSGVAAEVIGIPTGSIGEKLYETKLYLATDELFAWTLVIVLISIVFEKTVVLLLKRLEQRLR